MNNKVSPILCSMRNIAESQNGELEKEWEVGMGAVSRVTPEERH